MGKKLKIGILGCADIAKRYAIKAFQAIDNAEVTSIASRDYEKAKEWASIFNIKAETSYDALLENKEIDAVYIPLPIGLHKEWALKAASAGKHIICEKSLADSLDAAQEIVDSCRAHDVVLYENFMCGFHPQHQKVQSVIEAGDIGQPFVFQSYFGFSLIDKHNIRYDRALGGGSLNDAGAYTIFMARKIFNQEPLSVSCSLTYDKISNVDTQGSALLQFPNNQTALVAFSFNAAYQNNYSVWGSQGLIRVKRAYSIPPDMQPQLELIKNDRNQDLITSIDLSPVNQFELIFHDFCEMVLDQDNKKSSIEAIRASIISQARALEALRVSAREGKQIQLANL